MIDDDRYPMLARVLASGALRPEGSDGPTREFEFGLPLVLDSIEARIVDAEQEPDRPGGR